MGWLAAAADHAVSTWDATPVFLPGQRYNDPDLETAERVVARMAHGGRAVLAGRRRRRGAPRAIFAGADAVVSSRLHPLILAATAGVPVVGLAITEKVRAFLVAVGVGEQLVSPWARFLDPGSGRSTERSASPSRSGSGCAPAWSGSARPPLAIPQS